MIILITGANRGLGLSLTREALGRGHMALAACRVLSQDLRALTLSYPDKLRILHMDICDDAAVQAAADEARQITGSVDVIINNAAVLLESKYFSGDPVTDLPLADVERTLQANVMGAIRVTHHFAPLLYQSNSPWLLNITSEGAVLKPGGSHYMAYAISKAALNMYTQKVRNYYLEQKPGWPIRVYMIHPGRMDTLMGVENAQISPDLPARGILDLLEDRPVIPAMDIPFIDYLGRPMPITYIGG